MLFIKGISNPSRNVESSRRQKETDYAPSFAQQKPRSSLSSPIRLVSLVYDPIKGGSAAAGIGPV